MCNATSNINMSTFYDHYYRTNNRLLFLLGIASSQNWLDRIFRNIFLNFILIVAFLIQICHFYVSRFEIELIVKDLQLFIMFMCCSVSYYNLLLQFSNLKKINDRIKHDWEQLSDEEEVLVMRKYATDSNYYVWAITLIFSTFAIFLVFPSAVHLFLYAARTTNDTQLILPISIKLFSRFEEYFYLTLTFEYFCILIIYTLGISIYSSFVLLIMHACALLRLVAIKIDQPFKKVSTDVPYDWSSSVKHDAHEWIKRIVKYYGNAIEFIETLNDFTEKAYIIEVFLGIFLIIIDIFYLFQSLKMSQSIVFKQYMYELFMCGFYIGGTAFIMYLNCYIGQKLLDHGTAVLDSFYQVSLYELPPRCQKVLPLLIMRSTKPCVVSIGGMYASSHDFFARFMNTSLSYAIVCYKMR